MRQLLVAAMVGAVLALFGGAVAAQPGTGLPTAGEGSTELDQPGERPSGAEPASAQPAASTPDDGHRTGETLAVIKIVIGLSVVIFLAYLGTHPRVRQLEDTFRVAQVVTAGFPFVALGLIARQPSIGILSEEVIDSLTPLLSFGLGWVGFIVGFQFDVRFLERVPRGTAVRVAVEASLPFAVITVACGGLLLAFGRSWEDGAFFRDAIVLGAAGAMTAPRTSRGITDRGWAWLEGTDGLVGQLDEIAGVIGLMFLAAYFRPAGAVLAWELPGTVWVFLMLGIGVALGLLMFVMMRAPKTSGEFLAVALGFVAFAAGIAGYLHVSPIVVCFVAGWIVANFPCEQRDQLMSILSALERPIHLVFLTVVGALWDVNAWQGWVLLPAFLAARIGGKWLGVTASANAVKAVMGTNRPGTSPGTHAREIVVPLSVLSIAMVVSMQSLYPHGSAVPWVVTAVIGGAIVTEILVQLVGGPIGPEAVPSPLQGPPAGGSGAGSALLPAPGAEQANLATTGSALSAPRGPGGDSVAPAGTDAVVPATEPDGTGEPAAVDPDGQDGPQ